MRFVLLVALALACSASAVRAEWKTVLTRDGISVSQKEVKDRALPMFRAVSELEADPERILALIQNVDRHTEWMPDLSEARIVRETEDELWVYRVQDAPWPIADRDVVLRSRMETIEPGKEIRIDFEAATLEEIPPQGNIVRIPHLLGHYRIRALRPGWSRVEYEVDVDLGGSLPDWLTTRVGLDQPFETLRGLRTQLNADTN